MEFQNVLPIPYEMITPEQKKEICNGCGGKGSKIRPPHGLFYATSCNHHDYGYNVGNTEEDRLRCDRRLRTSMLQDCRKLAWYKRPRYYLWAELYYLAVRKYGGEFFYYGSEKKWPVPTTDQVLLLKEKVLKLEEQTLVLREQVHIFDEPLIRSPIE